MESRVANVAFESNEARCPISGLFSRFKRANSPAFTFLEAIQDVLSAEESQEETIHGMSRDELESVCHTLMGMACEKKREMGARCPLNEHEIAALYLYTAEFFDGACYYAAINGLLRDKNRTGIKPFTRIIWLTLLASSKCPPFTRHTLHRGIKLATAEELRAVEAIYADGRTVTWGQFSSCSTKLSTQNDFLGQSGYRMLFNIEVNHDNSVPNTARMISQLSLVPSEEEVLLPPNTRVFVVSSYSPSPDMVIVSLQVAPSLDNIFPNAETVTTVPQTPATVPVPTPTPAPTPAVASGVKVFVNGDRYEGDLLDGNIRRGKGTMIYANGNRYEGDWVSDSRTGNGVLTWANGDRYEGAFKDDKKLGKGTMIYANGCRYDGDWVNDFRTGKGIYTWTNGDRYEGDFMEHMRHGKGAMVYADGNRYDGDWVNGSQTGKGVYTLANGDRYEGDFKANKKHGRGTMTYVNGNRYEGDWVNDSRTGKGVETYPDGSRYDGDFMDGIGHGKGIMIYSNGNRYEGDWVNDSRTGRGVYLWANGDRYEGDFMNDKKSGKGTANYVNGNRYEGDWMDDSMSGKGVWTWATGDRCEGDFKDGMVHGKGIEIFSNGNRYEGDYVKDSRTGKGVYAWVNGDRYEGGFKNGDRHGKGTMVYANGDRYEGDWVEDRMASSSTKVSDGVRASISPNPVVGGAQQFLASQDWPAGLSATLLRNIPKVGMRYFIIDDSGSMATGDGHRIVGDRKKKVSVSCTRWVELADAMRFHAGLAYSGKFISQFRLLNGNGPILIGQPDDDDFSYRHFLELMDGSPSGLTPLCRHINEVVREIRGKEQHLRRNGQIAIVMIATDGESSDGDIAAALKSLESLPAHVIIRLCTDEEKVVSYWNNIDKGLELQLDILDDFSGEAEEVMTHNGWLTYGEPIHRMREFGVTIKEFDLLDEGRMSQDQIITFIGILFNVAARDIPHPQLDWKAFQEFVSQKNMEAGFTWNPLNKQFQRYINESQLSSYF